MDAAVTVGGQEGVQRSHVRPGSAQAATTAEPPASGKGIGVSRTLVPWCNRTEIVGLVHRGRGGWCGRSGGCKDAGAWFLEDIARTIIREHRSHALVEGCAEDAQSVLTVILIRSTYQEQGAAIGLHLQAGRSISIGSDRIQEDIRARLDLCAKGLVVVKSHVLHKNVATADN